MQKWRASYKRSPFAAILETRYWLSNAYLARGQGAINTVTPEGLKIYREWLKKAESTLIQSKPYAATSPLWYKEYLNLTADLGWPVEKRLALFNEAIERHPKFIDCFDSTVIGLLPKWGGSWQLVETFAQNAVKSGETAEGKIRYSEIYVRVANNELTDPNFNLFRDTSISWPTMREGFKDMMARYPNSTWNANRFAVFACKAQDKEAYQSIRPYIGKAFVYEAWDFKQELLVACDKKFGWVQP